MKIVKYLVAILVLLCFTTTAALATVLYVVPKPPAEKEEHVLPDGTYNILCAGVDEGKTNADTIVVISFNTKENKINLLSVPRDTMSNVPRENKKINASFGEGGIKETIKEVEMLTDLHIDRYVVTSFEAFEKAIDAIGGVEMDVPQDLEYDDPYQDLHIDLKKGLQRLDGKKALQFVRFRKGYITGDIGRIGAQQLFFKALAQQLTSVEAIKGYPTLANIVSEDMTTDLTVPEMLWFAKAGLKVDLQSGVRMFLLPGTGTYIDGISYYIPSAQALIKMLNEHFFTGENKISAADLDLIPLAIDTEAEFSAEEDDNDSGSDALDESDGSQSSGTSSKRPSNSYNPYHSHYVGNGSSSGSNSNAVTPQTPSQPSRPQQPSTPSQPAPAPSETPSGGDSGSSDSGSGGDSNVGIGSGIPAA